MRGNPIGIGGVPLAVALYTPGALARRLNAFSLGDHFLIVLQQRSQPSFRYRARGPVTASPVVADVNGDGAPEVVVTGAGLHVIDRRGRDIRG